MNHRCPDQEEVTERVVQLCDGESSCSVMPDTPGIRPNRLQTCGKMHLSLTYFCGKTTNPGSFYCCHCHCC
ncbi:unnamed protein product [Protopolystoma xenopodis]|uniref:Uncharacterized protein n=1 Tax=Protopolystoma xenopodis TaxID=117903 RepID=A0A3S5CQA0_9PLAT|nr:unnamed protein product [Protopolystoma xenopodis]